MRKIFFVIRKCPKKKMKQLTFFDKIIDIFVFHQVLWLALCEQNQQAIQEAFIMDKCLVDICISCISTQQTIQMLDSTCDRIQTRSIHFGKTEKIIR